jgi:predicted nucleic acid-binding protein
MNGILPDSTVWIDFNNPRTINTEKTSLEGFLSDQFPIWICPPVFQEVLQGCRTAKELKAAKYWFLKCYRGRVGVYQAAECGAAIYRTLRQKGITIRKPNDCLIAAYCILNNLALLHHDRDFDPMEQYCGLIVVH